MKLVLLGPPGAGKGTHAVVLSQKYGAPQLAAGDILRHHTREKTKLGLQAKDIIESGSLVPDQLVNQMMLEEIERCGMAKGFILDGYPRTIGQAEALDSFLTKKKTQLDAVLNFATSEKMIIDRLSGRRVCPNCRKNYHLRNIKPKRDGICDLDGEKLIQRKDDEPATIQHRLKMYDQETKPLIDYYRKKKLLHEVPGDFDIEELQAVLKDLFVKLKLIA